MITGIVVAYAVSAVAVALLTAVRSFGLRPLRRETGRAEQVVLLLVALAAGAVWVLFVPVYAFGWLRSTRAAVVAGRVSGATARLRDRVVPWRRHRLAH